MWCSPVVVTLHLCEAGHGALKRKQLLLTSENAGLGLILQRAKVTAVTLPHNSLPQYFLLMCVWGVGGGGGGGVV